METQKSKELGKYKGWLLKEVLSVKKQALFVAYFNTSPQKPPIMLYANSLKNLKTKLDGVKLYKGKLYYQNYV